MTLEGAERHLADCADVIIGSMWTKAYDGIVDDIDTLEAQSSSPDADAAFVIAAARIVADLRVLAAHKHRRPLEECDDLLERRRHLGFSSVSDEVISLSAHARYCEQAGHREIAAKHALLALGVVEQHQEIAQPIIPEDLEKWLRQIATSL